MLPPGPHQPHLRRCRWPEAQDTVWAWDRLGPAVLTVVTLVLQADADGQHPQGEMLREPPPLGGRACEACPLGPVRAGPVQVRRGRPPTEVVQTWAWSHFPAFSKAPGFEALYSLN